MFKRLSIVAAAVALGAGANVAPAAAHSADALHQHGWSQYRFRPAFNCGNASQVFTSYTPGWVGIDMPDLMTTPGGNQYVYFTARLEYYNFASKSWVITGEAKPWVRTVTNGSGPALSWREYDAYGRDVRYAPTSWSWNVASGNYYRVHLYFHWGYDGTRFYDDATGYCYVS